MSARGEYQTKQGAQLLAYLKCHAKEHITAAELVHALAENGTPMGTATVYRRLEKLEAQGLVRRYTSDERGGSACWQYADPDAPNADCQTHFHLKCTCCGELYHLDCDHLQEIAAHVQADHGFSIDPSRTVFYGICAHCTTDQTHRTSDEKGTA